MRLTFTKLSAAIAALALAVVAMPTRANAAYIFEFDDVAVHGGTVKQVGNAIIGTNVLFDLLTLEQDGTGIVLKAAQCGTAATVTDACVLNFQYNLVTHTGNITMKAPKGVYDAGPDNAPDTADTGALILANNSDVFTGTLDTAGFIGATVFGAEGTDTMSSDLIDFFGVLISGDLALSTTDIRVARTGAVSDADAVNRGEINFIPEPGMLSLFGMGLLGIGRGLRKKRQQA